MTHMQTTLSPESQKTCSICGVSFPNSEYVYGNRDNRSYCRQCNKQEKAAYTQGGVEAARAFRQEMRRRWQPSSFTRRGR